MSSTRAFSESCILWCTSATISSKFEEGLSELSGWRKLFFVVSSFVSILCIFRRNSSICLRSSLFRSSAACVLSWRNWSICSRCPVYSVLTECLCIVICVRLSYILDNTFNIINCISYVLVEGQTQLYKMYTRVGYIWKIGSLVKNVKVQFFQVHSWYVSKLCSVC